VLLLYRVGPLSPFPCIYFVMLSLPSNLLYSNVKNEFLPFLIKETTFVNRVARKCSRGVPLASRLFIKCGRYVC
jgi:hypothetical protein